MTAASIPESLFELPVEERIALADRLYASVPADWQGWVDKETLQEAERRDAELDAHPEMEVSHEQFLAEFAGIRQRK